MPTQNRSRSACEESPHRKPFSASPSSRFKYSFPVVNTPVLRRSRHNTENQPPEVVLNVKANSPFSETNASPALHPSKSASAKGKHHGSLSLPPRPPPPRPSSCQNPVKSGIDAQGNVKRKLNLEPSLCAAISVSCHPPHEQDNGVKVIIRLRPCNQKEESEEATQIVEKISSDSLCLADQSFTFDHVAGQDSSQQSLFEMVGMPLVENCLQGFNSSIFAYGQTGSGKTFTMWGSTHDLMAQPPSEERGLTPRVFECLFQRIKEEEKKNAEKQLRYQCRCSFFEIYNEQITDLLEPLQKNLQVREDTKTGVYVENLTEEFVSSVSDVFLLMVKGLGNRKIASTSMNLESSRSHTLFTCVIESRCKSMSDGVSSVRTSRINLVDLAGSERQKLTGAAGDRLKEAGNINRSLSQLGNLINILAEVSQSGKPRHIPYRDSRLTFLLQESLGGNAKLVMICAISPASSCKSETLSTLRFAQRAKSIQNKAVINEETEDDVKILREHIRQLKDELMRMKSNETIPGAAGSYSTSWNARRSFNLLRMSLNRPMTLPHTDSDTDEEMEIDEDAVECADTLKPDNLGNTDLDASGSEKKLQNGHHDFDAHMLLDSIKDEDVNFMASVKSPSEEASIANCPTEFIKFCAGRDDGQIGIQGLNENIKSDELRAQESYMKSQPDENSEIDLHDSDISTVNMGQSSCSEKLLVPIVLVGTSDTGAENFKIDSNDSDNDIVNTGQPSCLEELFVPTLEKTSDIEADNVKIIRNNNIDQSSCSEKLLVPIVLGTSDTGAENFKIDLNDFDNDIVNTGQPSWLKELFAPSLEKTSDIEAGNVKIILNNNIGQSSCSEEVLAPTLQATNKPLCQIRAFEEFHLNIKVPSALEMECRTCERPAFQETMHEPLSFSGSYLDSFIQAENVGLLVSSKSPLQESSNVEPESGNTECISHDKEATGVWNRLPAEVCRTSFQKEQSVCSKNSRACKNMLQGFNPAPGSTIKSLSDDFAGVEMSAEFNSAHSSAHYEPLSFSSSHSDSFLQAENGGLLVPGGSPLQESSNVETESGNTGCVSHGRKATGVWNRLPAEVGRTSFQIEQSVCSKNSRSCTNVLQGFNPAHASTIKSLSDDFEGVEISAELNSAHSNPHYLEGFAKLDQSRIRFDVACSWVGANASQQDINQDEAHGHGGGEDLLYGPDGMRGATPGTEHVLKSPILSISPHLALSALEAPILSVSPRLIDDRSKSFGMSALPVSVQGASIEVCTVNYVGHEEDAETDTQVEESMETAIKASPVTTNLRASQNLSSPTDRLAASLHRGLQILENHQKKVNSNCMSMVRFSFQKPEWDKPKVINTLSKSVQTSLVCFSENVPELLDMRNIDLSTKQVIKRLNLDQVSMVESSTPQRRSDFQLNENMENMEAILAGALRRERTMEEDLSRKAAEIEQLNQLVRQYKHERECNAVLQHSLEDKIARLESLMDGTLPTDSFLNEEWSSLINEHKILQERYDHHPEVTLANIRQQRLCEDMEKYRTFCELGERDALLGEVSQLRNQLQYYVEFDAVRPMKQRQRSLTPRAKVNTVENDGVGRSPLLDKTEFMEENSNPTAASVECQMCKNEAAQCMEREGEWMSVLEELRVEVEEYKQLAEKRKHEVGGQQRCADEMKEALQMAMEGHARLLDQYAELQEKHIGLLAKHRRIRDAMSTARKKAGKLKFLGGGKWYEAQAAELIAVKLEQEQERKAAKEQIEWLQAQLRDTADAVQAAGELLVRLKEAEEAVLIAQDAAALAEQDADKLYREIDKLKRRHSTELATLQQRLLEARLQKSSVCPMCVMAERVKFEFTGVDEEEAQQQEQEEEEAPSYPAQL